MKREEILNKAKKENKVADEWQFDVLKNANAAALILLVAIIAGMLIKSTTQYYTTGMPFANPFIFVFQLACIVTIQSFIKFCYDKKPLEIITAIIGFIAAGYIALFLI